MTVVVYACTRCPFCKVVVPALYAAVTDGPLAGKVRLYLLIDGQPYLYEMNAEAMLDVLEEAYDDAVAARK